MGSLTLEGMVIVFVFLNLLFLGQNLRSCVLRQTLALNQVLLL